MSTFPRKPHSILILSCGVIQNGLFADGQMDSMTLTYNSRELVKILSVGNAIQIQAGGMVINISIGVVKECKY